eukprot:NODE_7232_length_1598_cov_3.278042.p2 GENE.NODE_7232_length_1598_cov_3.278042~~NODE_7232_length_1598_cov_3.278042.p2  ORF type:complete len:403 (+),score=118.84 NODE_7232_length_1598_cov_3.278042:102-1310(+)
MGQGPASPVTAKESCDGSAPEKGLAWGVSCMQGWRATMEDAHIVLPRLEGEGWGETALFGVMDGHGGDHVALFCKRHLPVEVAKGPSRDVAAALVTAFHRMDELLREPARHRELCSLSRVWPTRLAAGARHWSCSPDWIGCTAVICCVRPDAIIVGNAGDSRAVLSRSGQAVPLSEDHKPNAPGERERIMRAGGSVLRQQIGQVVQFRVNGNLNLSRSIGDLEYKRNTERRPSEQMICSTPDVRVFPRGSGDEFLVIACDGLWDVLGNQDAVDFVRERLPQVSSGGNSLSGIMEELLDHCLSADLATTGGLGGDNMTAMIVLLSAPSTAPAPANVSTAMAGLTWPRSLPWGLGSLGWSTTGGGGELDFGIVEDSVVVPWKPWFCGPPQTHKTPVSAQQTSTR